MVPLPGEFQPGHCPPGLYPVHLQSVCDPGSDVWVEEPLQVSTPNALPLISHLLCAGRTRSHRCRGGLAREREPSLGLEAVAPGPTHPASLGFVAPS